MSVSLRGIGDDPARLLHRPDEAADAPQRGARRRGGQRHGRADGLEPGADPGARAASTPAGRRRRSTRCTPARTNEFERSAITDMLFGSVTDVLDRYLPDKEKHGALRGMLSFLAVNTTYRGPATPGTAAALAFGFAVPDENAMLMKKLRGGIGALTAHWSRLFASAGGELRLRSKVEEILTADGRVTGVRLEDGSTIGAPIVVSGCRTRPHRQRAGRPGGGAGRHPGALLPRRPPRQLSADALRARRHARVRGAVRDAQRSRDAVRHRHFQHPRGTPAAVGGLPGAASCPPIRRSRCRFPSVQRSRPGAAG